MTKEQAQEITKKEGFAWDVTDIMKTTEHTFIFFCEYNKNNHIITYDTTYDCITKIQ